MTEVELADGDESAEQGAYSLRADVGRKLDDDDSDHDFDDFDYGEETDKDEDLDDDFDDEEDDLDDELDDFDASGDL